MPDNSTNDITEKIIQYIDHEMTMDGKLSFEKLLQQDAALQERYQFILAAKQAIRSKGLREQVGKVHEEYIRSIHQSKAKTIDIARKGSFFKIFMRIAAVLVCVVGGYGIFEFGTTNSNSLFEDNFINYQIPVNRGAEQLQLTDSLYNAENYNAVITAFNAIAQKNQEDYFLAAQSFLHLDKPGEAIAAFQHIEKMNASATNQQYFVEETDYYLAMAYIKAGRIEEAEKQLNKITSNKQHLFYHKAEDISRLKLKILSWKE